MLIVYDSLTGNVERFINKLHMKNLKITDGLIVKEPFILVTYTFGFGGIPESTSKFLNQNFEYIIGVASSGNKVWGSNFARAADLISDNFLVPLILKFELSGTKKDIDIFTQGVTRIYDRANTKMVEIK